MIGIGKQGKAQIVFVVEFFLDFRRVRTDSENSDVFVPQPFKCVPHTLCLDGSAGGVGFGVEIKKKSLSGKIGKPDILSILIF